MEVEPGKEPPYSGTWDCAVKTIKKDGPFGLYRGITAPLLGIAPVFALCFWGYSIGESIVRAVTGSASTIPLSLLEVTIAGAISAIPTTVLMTPVERVKCLLQVQKASESGEQYTGITDCAQKLVKARGPLSLYKGFGATLARDIPASIAYFGFYELMKRLFSAGGTLALSPAHLLISGGIAGIMNWVVCIPFDTVKTKLQTAPDDIKVTYFGIWREVLKTKGFLGLFQGIVPIMIRAFPANAACFFGVEVARKFLSSIGM